MAESIHLLCVIPISHFPYPDSKIVWPWFGPHCQTVTFHLALVRREITWCGLFLFAGSGPQLSPSNPCDVYYRIKLIMIIAANLFLQEVIWCVCLCHTITLTAVICCFITAVRENPYRHSPNRKTACQPKVAWISFVLFGPEVLDHCLKWPT